MQIEHIVFGKAYLCNRAVSYTMRQVKDECLRELYRQFKSNIDNVHTDLDTVQVHFLEDDDGVDLLWTCSHFEGNGVIDIVGLLRFLHEITYHFGSVEITVDLLDGIAEKLIIRVFDVPYRFPESPTDVQLIGE
jgi:hypothetical protein